MSHTGDFICFAVIVISFLSCVVPSSPTGSVPSDSNLTHYFGALPATTTPPPTPSSTLTTSTPTEPTMTITWYITVTISVLGGTLGIAICVLFLFVGCTIYSKRRCLRLYNILFVGYVYLPIFIHNTCSSSTYRSNIHVHTYVMYIGMIVLLQRIYSSMLTGTSLLLFHMCRRYKRTLQAFRAMQSSPENDHSLSRGDSANQIQV